MVKRAIEMEGTATGEHGVGLVKRDYLPHEVGQTTVDLMRKVSLPPLYGLKRLSLTIIAIIDETSFRPVVLAQLRQDCAHGEASSGRGSRMVGISMYSIVFKQK
jgi:hypothetical protein